MKRVIRAKVSAHSAISEALEYDITRGMNRCDKYLEEQLTDSQRSALFREIDQSFWLALEDDEIELK